MIIEIKDLPTQKIKSVDIHIDFLESNSNNIEVDYTPKVSDNKTEEHKKDVGIPDEMLNGEF